MVFNYIITLDIGVKQRDDKSKRVSKQGDQKVRLVVEKSCNNSSKPYPPQKIYQFLMEFDRSSHISRKTEEQFCEPS